MRALVVTLLLVTSLAAVGPAGGQQATEQPPNSCVGTIEERPASSTVVSIQGTRITSEGALKENALLVSFAPSGAFEWAQNSTANGRWWAYDVDPLENGNLLYATTQSRHSVVGEFDPDAGEYVWVEHFDGEPDSETNPLIVDAHDADLVGDELLLVDKGQGHERLLAYNLTTERVTWEWRFEDHPEAFPESGGGPPHDWTHVNDVDRVSEDLYITSPRNFDKVIFVNRSTDEIELTLGADDEYDILDEQHNPDHLWGPNGEHTLLVADSINDRAVEYAYDDESDTWERVWSVAGLDEPRDADRLANGNTLITDRRGHRVLEVTPEGRTVWEVYTPYEPYDTERNEPRSNGPTMREHGVTGEFEVSNDAAFTDAEIEQCAGSLFEFASSEGGGLIDDRETFSENDDIPSPAGGDSSSETGDADGSDSDGGSDETGPESGSSLPAGPIAAAGLVALVVVLGLGYRQFR
ncbi:MAG: aryl-sulfate sulfotransferase [Haloarculaceae archaeon]